MVGVASFCFLFFGCNNKNVMKKYEGFDFFEMNTTESIKMPSQDKFVSVVDTQGGILVRYYISNVKSMDVFIRQSEFEDYFIYEDKFRIKFFNKKKKEILTYEFEPNSIVGKISLISYQYEIKKDENSFFSQTYDLAKIEVIKDSIQPEFFNNSIAPKIQGSVIDEQLFFLSENNLRVEMKSYYTDPVEIRFEESKKYTFEYIDYFWFQFFAELFTKHN